MKPIFEFRYKMRVGMLAWILHRLTGLALVLYLCMHIYVIHNLAYGPERFNEVMKYLGSPLFKILEIGLFGAILFHTFNGLRVIIVDFWGGSKIHKKLFWLMAGATVVLFIIGAARMASHIIGVAN